MEAANETYFENEARLRGAVEEGFPDAWKPTEAGETLIGVFRGRETGRTPYGEKWIVTLVDKEGKRWAVWLLHTALESQFRRAQPAIGELVAVRYEGKETSKDGKGTVYDNWTVKVDRPDATTVDWGSPSPGVPPSAAAAAPVDLAEQAPPHTDDDIPF